MRGVFSPPIERIGVITKGYLPEEGHGPFSFGRVQNFARKDFVSKTKMDVNERTAARIAYVNVTP